MTRRVLVVDDEDAERILAWYRTVKDAGEDDEDDERLAEHIRGTFGLTLDYLSSQ